MATDDKPTRGPSTKAEGFRTIYVNSSIMGFSPWDIRITLGQISQVAAGAVQEDQVNIIQSPMHAKAMLRSLTVTVAAYEAKFGQIPDLGKKQEPAKAAVDQPNKLKLSARRSATTKKDG